MVGCWLAGLPGNLKKWMGFKLEDATVAVVANLGFETSFLWLKLQFRLEVAYVRAHRRFCKHRPHEFGPAAFARPPPPQQKSVHMNLGRPHLLARRRFRKRRPHEIAPTAFARPPPLPQHALRMNLGPPHLRARRRLCKRRPHEFGPAAFARPPPLPQTPST